MPLRAYKQVLVEGTPSKENLTKGTAKGGIAYF
jgi:hypothetical protein